MNQLVLTVSLLYILFIIYIHYVYNYEKKAYKIYPIWREELNINPVLSAYLIDRDCEWTNLVLADILTLVNEGYVEMEKVGDDYRFTKLYDDDTGLNINNHQMMSYNMLFSLNGAKVNSISLKEFKNQFIHNENVVENAQVKEYAIKDGIRLELEKQGLMDLVARKRLFKFNKLAIKIMMLSILGFIISLFMWNKFYMILTIFWFFSSGLFYLTTNYNEEKLTDYGIECREKAIGLKNYIEEYTISEDKPIYTVNIYDYYYIMAVAIGEAEVAEKEFIKKEYNIGSRKKRLKNRFRKIIQLLGYISIIIYYIAILLLFE